MGAELTEHTVTTHEVGHAVLESYGLEKRCTRSRYKVQTLRLKIKINTREHFVVKGFKEIPGEHKVTRTQFLKNIAAKMNNENFASDLGSLLVSG